MERDIILKTFSDDVKIIERKIKYKHLYNIRNFAIKSLLKGSLLLYLACPFIVSGKISLNSKHYKENPPFIADEIGKKIKKEVIQSSSGYEIEHISNDSDYKTSALEYSTGWVKDENNLYTRTITSYTVSDKKELENFEKIFKMSEEELKDFFEIQNIKTIKKERLDLDDDIYNEEAIFIIKNIEMTDNTEKVLEKEEEVIVESAIFLFKTVAEGLILLFVVIRITDKLKFLEKFWNFYDKFKYLKNDDIEKLQQLLEIKRENFNFIHDELNENDIKQKCKLRNN